MQIAEQSPTWTCHKPQRVSHLEEELADTAELSFRSTLRCMGVGKLSKRTVSPRTTTQQAAAVRCEWDLEKYVDSIPVAGV